MDTIATDNPLTPNETATLAILARMLIPASTKYGVPGADDEVIFADVVATARSHAELIKQGLQALDSDSRQVHDAAFVDLTAAEQTERMDARRESPEHFVRTVVSIVVQCYYRDGRVKESLGMEPRPPFPEGFEVAPGDWSLLDPVRERGKVWRDAR